MKLVTKRKGDMFHTVHGCAHWKDMTVMPKNEKETYLRSYSQLVEGWPQSPWPFL